MNVIVEIGKALGKAVVAGVGLELARLATGHMRKRLGVKDEEAEKRDADLEKVKRENEALRKEIDQLKADRQSTTQTSTTPTATATTSTT